jgi:hypothetical protein
MTHPPGQPGQPEPDRTARVRRPARRDRIRAEIARNRRGDHTIPTWVLAVVAAVILAAFLWVIVTQ